MITRVKKSAVRASGVQRLFEGGAYSSKYGIVSNGILKCRDVR